MQPQPMRRALAIAALACATATSVIAPALADPQSDFNAVYGDWQPDHVITQCRWTQDQLQNAYTVASSNPDMSYDTSFQNAVQQEISRWKSGGCGGVLGTIRSASRLTGAEIVSVAGRGGAAREVVKIRNTSNRTIAFRKTSLRNRKNAKAVFPAKFALAKGKTVAVHVGCAPGKRHASFTKTTVWLCRRAQLFADKGDIAKLIDANGIVVSQRGFGSQKRRPVF